MLGSIVLDLNRFGDHHLFHGGPITKGHEFELGLFHGRPKMKVGSRDDGLAKNAARGGER